MSEKTDNDEVRDTNGRFKRHATLNKLGYRVGGTIGTGTYAKVKEAYCTSRRKNVAIKILRKRHMNDSYLNKFLPREVRVLRRLNHPHITSFLHFIETADHAYMVMEFASKGDLLSLVTEKKYFKEKSAATWFGQLVSAIDHCHINGVIHRDIKCENLLIDDKNNLKLSDFGFCRGNIYEKDQEVLCQTYCGSYAYSSPEVLTNSPYEGRQADVWSLGVVLYIMVHGRFPFDHTNPKKLYDEMSRGPTFPSDPKTSTSVRNLIRKILTKVEVRYTIAQIISHHWFITMVPSHIQVLLNDQGAETDAFSRYLDKRSTDSTTSETSTSETNTSDIISKSSSPSQSYGTMQNQNKPDEGSTKQTSLLGWKAKDSWKIRRLPRLQELVPSYVT